MVVLVPDPEVIAMDPAKPAPPTRAAENDGLAPGTVLADRYRVDRLLGRGGMGSVYDGYDLKLERPVAIKLLDMPGKAAAERAENLEREAVLLARLQHPNIVAVHEIGIAHDQTFIVMDQVRGTVVEEVLDYARRAAQAQGASPRRAEELASAIGLPVPQGRASLVADGTWHHAVSRVMLEVARTLEAAHHEGIVHRDIKPRNVMLRGDGTPVVLDFGLAGAQGRDIESAQRGLVGTVAYMAPEQVASGRTGNDPRSDVYQLGLLLYEMLTLERAYPGDDAHEVLDAIRRGRFRMPRAVDRGIPRDLEAVCLKAIELDPRRRYASARELREDLEHFLSGARAPLAVQGGALARGLRTTRYALRRRKLAAAAALALAAGTVGGAHLFQTEPVEVSWFRVRAGDDGSPQIERHPRVGSVASGDVLGATITSDEARYVYALSVFGDLNPPTWVLPMQLQPAEPEDGAEPEPARDGWGLRVARGETDLYCTRIDDVPAGTAPPPYEGLWVYVSSEPVPRLADWMSQLQRLSLASTDAGVRYAVARELFDAGPSRTRGGPVNLTAEDKRAFDRALTAEAMLGRQEDWELREPQRFEVFFPRRAPDARR